MKIEIKHRFGGTILFSGEFGSLMLAVEAAVSSGAYLRGADLYGADLRGADLYGADLRGADLHGAKGVHKNLCTPLTILLDQPGKIRAYKLVTTDGVGPYNGGITYEVGKTYEVDDANTDDAEDCGRGINLATLDWCLHGWVEGQRVLLAEFTAKDIAAIPIATDGKFRVHRCKIVKELDLKAIGWPPEKPNEKG